MISLVYSGQYLSKGVPGRTSDKLFTSGHAEQTLVRVILSYRWASAAYIDDEVKIDKAEPLLTVYVIPDLCMYKIHS